MNQMILVVVGIVTRNVRFFCPNAHFYPKTMLLLDRCILLIAVFFEKSWKKRKVVLLRKLESEEKLLVFGFEFSKSLLWLALVGTELKLSRNRINFIRNIRRWGFTGHGGGQRERNRCAIFLKSEGGVFSLSARLIVDSSFRVLSCANMTSFFLLAIPYSSEKSCKEE